MNKFIEFNVSKSKDERAQGNSGAFGGVSCASAFNPARALRALLGVERDNAVGPRMLGLKESSSPAVVRASKSFNDLDRVRRKLESRMVRLEHSGRVGSRAVLTFVLPTERKKITYREQQARLRRALVAGASSGHSKSSATAGGGRANSVKRLQPVIADGSLLDTLEKGVAYPVIHARWEEEEKQEAEQQREESSRDQHQQIQTPRRSASSDALLQPSKATKRRERTAASSAIFRPLDEEALGPSVCVQQGLYEEVKRIEPEFASTPRSDPRLHGRAFIFLGFKTLDTGFNSVLESTWRDWTGARAIYLGLHPEFDLARIVFYHRVSPANDLDLFTYVVMAEIWNVLPQNLIRALDFVQRMRVERLNGYISLYRDLGSVVDEAEEEEEEEADSVYHSASQESEDERASRGSTVARRRSSVSPLSGLDEEEDLVDQGIDVRRMQLAPPADAQNQHFPPSILVTESSSEAETTTRVRETLTIERSASNVVVLQTSS